MSESNSHTAQASAASLFASGGLAAAMPIAAIAWDPRLSIIGWNSAAEKLFGWTAKEALGADIMELLVPTVTRSHVASVLARVAAGEIPVSSVNENRTKCGSSIVCEWQNTLLRDSDGRVTAVIGMARDVGFEGRAEKMRERLQQIAAAANASLNLDDILLLIRSALMEVGGFDRAGVWVVEGGMVRGSWGTDTRGRLSDEHDIVERTADWGPKVAELARDRKGFYIDEQLRVQIPDEPDRFIPHAVMGLRSGNELVGIISVDNLLSGRPVTEEAVEPLLTFAEEAASAIRNARLLAERSRYLERQRRLSGLAAAISASTALNDVLRMVRDAVVDVGGFDRAAVFLYDREKSMLIGTWGTDRDGRREELSMSAGPISKESKMAGDRVVMGELAYAVVEDYTAKYELPPTHNMYGVRAHAVVPLRAGREILGVICVDNLLRDAPITEEDIAGLIPFANQAGVAIQNARLFGELTRAQDALVRSERMRATGEVALGIGRNIGSILSSVRDSAARIAGEESAPESVSSHARAIEKAANEGHRILERLLQATGQDAAQPFYPFSLSEVAEDAADLMRASWATQEGPRIDIRTDLERPLMVQGAFIELREAAINILRNAMEAMPEGGTIRLRCCSRGSDAVLEIADTGVGMTPSVRERIFEQFFTTKSATNGLGLGLSVASGIVERHGGNIEVESKPGEGTTFRVVVPMLADQRPPATPASKPPDLEGLRVLVVEDEEDVANVISRMLKLRGAKPEVVTSGALACQWLEREQPGSAVVLTDHGMPDMTGSELLKVVKERWPHVRRVLLSGLGSQQPEGVDPEVAEMVLSKPIRSNELAAALLKLGDSGAEI